MRAKLLLGSMFAVAAAACTVPPTPAPPTTVPPTIAPTTPTTTPPPPPAPIVDYDPADLVWFNADTNVWFRGDVGTAEVLFAGEATDIPAPADYDGDGRTDIVFVRDGRWLRPDGTVLTDLGAPASVGDAHAVPADYDGDGRAEAAWYRNSDATWWFEGQAPVAFGQGPSALPIAFSGSTADHLRLDFDYPVPADYDGDGRTDLATYSPRTGEWRILSSVDGTTSTTVLLPVHGMLPFPVPGDYDGVGHAQLAVLDDRGWLIEGHGSFEPLDPTPSGSATVILPAVADYDGDGRVERSYLEYSSDNRRFWHGTGAAVSVELGSGVQTTVPATTTMNPVYNVTRFSVLAACSVAVTPC